MKLTINLFSKTQVFTLWIGATGTVAAFAFGFNIFELEQNSGEAG